MKLTIACVLSTPEAGKRVRYDMGDVYRLRDAAARHWSIPHNFAVYTNNGSLVGSDVETRLVPSALKGWWAKMALFDTSYRLKDEVTVYYDLDSLLIGRQDPLLRVTDSFAICGNFTKEVVPDYPCRYGSCCMVLAPRFGDSIWTLFKESVSANMLQHRVRGDQSFIERVYPNARILQNAVPRGFFVGYRNLHHFPKAPPEGAAVIVYAGGRTPLTFGPKWAKKEWQR